MNNNEIKFIDNYVPTLETAKEYYLFVSCDSKKLSDKAREFYIKKIKKESLIKWNDLYINSLLDKSTKELINNYTLKSLKKICHDLTNLTMIFTDRKKTYQRIFTLIMKIHDKYGFFMNYKTNKSECYTNKINLYVFNFIKKLERKDVFESNENINEITYFFPKSLYEGIIPALYYLGYKDLYEEFFNNIICKIFSHFKEVSEFVKDNGIGYRFFYISNLNNYQLSINLSMFFTEYNLPVPNCLIKYEKDIDFKLYEYYENLKSEYIKYKNKIHWISSNRKSIYYNASVDEETHTYLTTVNLDDIKKYNEYYLNEYINNLEIGVNCYDLSSEIFYLFDFFRILTFILENHSSNYNINKRIVILLKTLFVKQSFIFNYGFILKNGYSRIFLKIKSLIIRNKTVYDNTFEEYSALTTTYYFKDKNILGYLPRLYYLEYFDLFDILLKDVVLPIYKHFQEDLIFNILDIYDNIPFSTGSEYSFVDIVNKFLEDNKLSKGL